MLKGIPKCISPALLRVLAEMGHGDEIVLADANFPAEALGKRVIRADGIGGCALLSAVLQLIPLDRYAEANFLLMQTTQGDAAPPIWKEYTALAAADENFRAGCMERYAFYERAAKAYAVVATGEEQTYANIILKKGVIA